MKKLILLLSLLFCVPIFAQNVKSDIENQFRDYNTLIVAKNFDKALDLYANEDFLKMFPKEQISALMEKMFNSPEINIKLEMPEDIAVSDKVIEEKGKKFVKISYQQKLQMKFNESGLNTHNLMTAMKTEFGEDQVKLNQETGFIQIDAKKEAVASSTDSKNWKFTVLEKKQIPLLKQYIPEQFLKEIQ